MLNQDSTVLQLNFIFLCLVIHENEYEYIAQMCNFLLCNFCTFIQIIFIKCFLWSVQSKLLKKNWSSEISISKFDFTVNLPPALTSLMMASSGNLQYSSALTLYGLLGFKRSLILIRYKVPKYKFYHSFFISYNFRQNQLNFLSDRFCCANLFHGLLFFNSLFWSFDHNWSENFPHL